MSSNEKDEKDLKYSNFKYTKSRSDYSEEELNYEIDICTKFEQTINNLYKEADIIYTNVCDKWNYVWESDSFQKILTQYYNCVPYEDHINAMIETYHHRELTVWEEADKLFPNTRKNMRREFYIYEEKIEKEDMNEEEKEWHKYVDENLVKDRYIFERTVPEYMRRSYISDL